MSTFHRAGRSLSVVQELRDEIRTTRNEQAVSDVDSAISDVQAWREEQERRVAEMTAALQQELDAASPDQRFAEPVAPEQHRVPSPPRPRPRRPREAEGDENLPEQPEAAALHLAGAERVVREQRASAEVPGGGAEGSRSEYLASLEQRLAMLDAKFSQ